MQNLVAFLTKNFHWLLFLLLEIISGILLFRYNSFQGSVWVSSANNVTGKVYEWRSGVEQFFNLKNRAQELALRNYRLENELHQARQMLYEQNNDTIAIDSALQEVFDHVQMLPARVVSNTLNKPDNLMTIDCGSADGVSEDMGVVCGMGLVGVIYMTGNHYSIVLPLLNTHSRISCSIRGSGYFGYLLWEGGDPTTAYLEDIPRHAQIEEGQWVETSGYSSIFPPGITVGQVIGVGNSTDGLSYRLKIRLSTDFGCLRDVGVIASRDYAERNSLLTAARDSLHR